MHKTAINFTMHDMDEVYDIRKNLIRVKTEASQVYDIRMNLITVKTKASQVHQDILWAHLSREFLFYFGTIWLFRDLVLTFHNPLHMISLYKVLYPHL